MNSREKILEKMRGGVKPFPEVSKLDSYKAMVPVDDLSGAELLALFIEKAEAASCVVHQAKSSAEAVETVLQLIGEDKIISSWELENIPLPDLVQAFEGAGISLVGEDAKVRVGLTGVDAALAATGSVVLLSGAGRFRAASLLPTKHIVVMTTAQILPDFESWWREQKTAGLENMRRYSNIVVISGPSRTADIAMELVMGMHGPRELDIVIIE